MSNSLVTAAGNLATRLGNYLTGRIPQDRRSLPLMRMPPQPLTPSQLDVDMVYAILTQSDVGDPQLLMSLYDTILFSDNHIQGELGKRQLAVLGDPINVAPRDPKNPADVKAAAFCKDQIDKTPTWFAGMAHLLSSCLWPVAIVERIYRRSAIPGVRYDLSELVPVQMVMLYFDARGPLRIWDVDGESGSLMGTNQMVDPMRYVTHRAHLLGDRDHRGGPMRSLVFWWLFSGFNRDWWVRFLDKYGSPFLVGKYDEQDDDSRLVLQQAFALATKLGGIVISNETDVDIKQAMTETAGKAFDGFHAICQAEKSKLIIGQTSSASGRDAGGLSGGGVADAQSEVRSDIRQFDRISLGETVRHQICTPLLAINGIPGSVTVTWGGEAVDDSQKTSASLSSLYAAGVELTDEGIVAVGERFGFGLRRRVMPPPADPVSPSSPVTTLEARPQLPRDPHLLAADLANDRVSRAGAADLARALSGDLAPIVKMLRESKSSHEFEIKMRDAFPSWTPDRTVPLLEAGLSAFSANAL